MKLIDKIIDWLYALDKNKKRIKTVYYLKDTQVAIAIILFFIIIGIVLYSIYDAGFPWYVSLIFIFLLSVGIFYLLIQITLEERKTKNQTSVEPIESIGLNFNRIVLDNIYYVLRGFEKIDVEKTAIDDFYSVLTQRFKETEAEIHFISMNWVELRYVLEKFKEKCGVEYSTFEKSNKLFLDGKHVTAKKLSNNGLRKHPDKYFTDKIDICFPK